MSNSEQKPRRRILLVIAGLSAGGAERQMVLLARGLDRSRYEVGLLVFNSKEKVHYQDVFDNPLWFRALGLSRDHNSILGLTLSLVKGIRRAVADFQPDIIHTSLNVANIAVRSTSLVFFPRIPVITSIRCNFLLLYSRIDQIIERLLCRRSAMITTNSEATRQQLLEVLSLPDGRVVTVENGIDTHFSPGTAPIPKNWPITTQRIGLIVGRLTEEKNHLALIKSLKTLEARKQLCDWHFILVGEGRLHSQIETAITDFSRFQLLPPTTDLLPYYRNADILLLPSLHEGMSNVALEAQASGVPVAITPSANTSGVVSQGCGWVLEGDLTSSLAEVLALNSDEIHQRAGLALKDTRKRFGIDRMVDSTQTIYERILDQRFA